ncbi:protein trichome birefringence-like 19 [Abrus precatorius]|uniref:Protein trichome birefringence-like 19 n=1 Tax=Abrus precatorius TaxID=3816 RepID=A0A8B8LW28_ABRPR|nr:protein trichome birefringence-like 19 [Abrus precatorius]
MKLQDIDQLFSGPKQMIPKVTLIAILAILIFTITPLCYPLVNYTSFLKINKYKKPSPPHDEPATLPSTYVKKCDIFKGEWVPNPNAPYYTNKTCWAIHEHQNCMKHGRPDSEFMKWRWKPYECEVPIFNPFQFLEIVKGKSMAFVGDSVGRNQMQSMICLLSRVEWPVDVSYPPGDFFIKRWKYPSYNFTMVTFWTPHLVRAEKAYSNGSSHIDHFNLYLDEFDEKWTTQIKEFDYVIIDGGHWFFGPMVFYEKRKIIGCHKCLLENVTNLTMFYGYRRALSTALKAISSLETFKGITFLRTFSPSHFENGSWDHGGNCIRNKPFSSRETRLESLFLELYKIQLEEFKVARKEAKMKGSKFMLFDITQAMLLRPDGHPSKYGQWIHENMTKSNDCVHWCLPGPIDTWGDLLLEMLKMKEMRNAEE